jgi:hypothetical protein
MRGINEVSLCDELNCNAEKVKNSPYQHAAGNI